MRQNWFQGLVVLASASSNVIAKFFLSAQIVNMVCCVVILAMAAAFLDRVGEARGGEVG